MAEQSVSRSREMPHSPEAIFSVLSSPQGHVQMDGSGTVKEVISGDDPLRLGSSFRMKMKMGVPYRMKSTVVEYEENRLIAWAHYGKHRWRYELEPLDEGTRVTETFDWSTALWPKGIELLGYPESHPPRMEESLAHLDSVVAARS